MAKIPRPNSIALAQARRQSQQLGPLGRVVWALPPVQRAILRDAMRVTAMAATAREIDRTLMLTMIDTAFDEIEVAAKADERGTRSRP